MAKTPAERQQLLRRYWEPTPEEREQGDKAPTAAHRAIAKLVAGGYIKVIITTNFDRLIESALGEEGVQHLVLSTDDQIGGAVPIVHAPCTVLKLHGDYLDTRIRNTQRELEKYEDAYNRLLDRIFDEFGLIVCGWSAEWDAALRDSIYRTASRRYTTYWTVHDELREEGKALISHRKAETISIQHADSFFQALAEQVASMENFSRPHPLSTEIAVATVKRFLPDEQSDIRLHDLVNDLVEGVVQGASGPDFSVEATVNAEELNTRVRRYDALCETLVAVAAVSGYWCERRHQSLWAAALQRLIEEPPFGRFYPMWLKLRRYPATLLLYSLGIGAVVQRRFDLLGELLSLPSGTHEEPCVANVLAPCSLGDTKRMQQLEGMSKRRFALNDWIFQVLRKPSRSILPSDSAYGRAFDELEMLLALSSAARERRSVAGVVWHPPGCYVYGGSLVRDYPYGGSLVRDRILDEIDKSITEEGSSSPYVTSHIFGATPSECRGGLSALKEYIRWMEQRLWTS